jgi:hypothetical protein
MSLYETHFLYNIILILLFQKPCHAMLSFLIKKRKSKSKREETGKEGSIIQEML